MPPCFHIFYLSLPDILFLSDSHTGLCCLVYKKCFFLILDYILFLPWPFLWRTRHCKNDHEASFRPRDSGAYVFCDILLEDTNVFILTVFRTHGTFLQNYACLFGGLWYGAFYTGRFFDSLYHLLAFCPFPFQ